MWHDFGLTVGGLAGAGWSPRPSLDWSAAWSTPGCSLWTS